MTEQAKETPLSEQSPEEISFEREVDLTVRSTVDAWAKPAPYSILKDAIVEMVHRLARGMREKIVTLGRDLAKAKLDNALLADQVQQLTRERDEALREIARLKLYLTSSEIEGYSKAVAETVARCCAVIKAQVKKPKSFHDLIWDDAIDQALMALLLLSPDPHYSERIDSTMTEPQPKPNCPHCGHAAHLPDGWQPNAHRLDKDTCQWGDGRTTCNCPHQRFARLVKA